MVLLTFTVPQADDFCYAASAHALGLVDGVAWFYEHWSGRLTASVLIMLPTELAGSDMGAAYRLVLGGIMAGLVGTCFVAVRQIWPDLRGAAWVAAGAGFAFTLIANQRAPRDLLYWLSASATYTLPLMAVILFAAVCYRSLRSGQASGAGTALWLFPIVWVGGMGAEPAGPLLAGIGVLTLVAHGFLGTRPGWPVWGVIAVAALATLLVAAAPGNEVRLAQADGRSVVEALLFGPVHFIAYLGLRVDSYGFLAWLVIVAVSAARAPVIPERALKIRLAWAVSGFLLGGTGVFILGVYGIGETVPPRAMNLVSGLGAILLTAAAVDVGAAYGSAVARRFPQISARAALTAAVVVLALSLQMVRAILDLSGPAQAYAATSEQWLAQFLDGAGTSVELEDLPNRPYHLFYESPAPEDSWVNRCIEDMYGVADVRRVVP